MCTRVFSEICNDARMRRAVNMSWALCHSLWRGGFLCTGPMAVYRDKSTGLMLIMEYLFAGPGYGPQRLSDFSSKGSTRMNI